MSSQSLIDPTNIFVLPANIAGNFWYADWRGAWQRGGVIGVLGEALQAASGATSEPFFVPCASTWQIDEIRALLLRHGVKLWGVGYWHKELFFRVKGRQAHWAQYVMLRADVPLLHGYLAGSRAIPKAPTAAPKRGWLGRLFDW